MDFNWDSVLNGAVIGGVIGAIIGILIYGLGFIIRMFSGQSKTKNKNRDISRWGDGG